MRTRLLLLALPVLASALSPTPRAAAQAGGEGIEISVTYPHATRTVYRQALGVLDSLGYALRVRSLDAALMTQPRTAPSALGGTATTQLLVEMERRGDSTHVVLRGRAVPPSEGKPGTAPADVAGAHVLEVLVPVAAALGDRLDSLPAKVAPDPRETADAFGYSPRAPIRVGNGNPREGAAREQAYLARLRGPDGQEVAFVRLGSCCSFETPVLPGGAGLLDAYEVTYPGLATPAVLYLNMYDPPGAEQGAPEGFVLALEPTAGARS